MTAYSHVEIKLLHITSKVPQANILLTKFNNYGYHTVLCESLSLWIYLELVQY